jgi:hypothetical protein
VKRRQKPCFHWRVLLLLNLEHAYLCASYESNEQESFVVVDSDAIDEMI